MSPTKAPQPGYKKLLTKLRHALSWVGRFLDAEPSSKIKHATIGTDDPEPVDPIIARHSAEQHPDTKAFHEVRRNTVPPCHHGRPMNEYCGQCAAIMGGYHRQPLNPRRG